MLLRVKWNHSCQVSGTELIKYYLVFIKYCHSLGPAMWYSAFNYLLQPRHLLKVSLHSNPNSSISAPDPCSWHLTAWAPATHMGDRVPGSRLGPGPVPAAVGQTCRWQLSHLALTLTCKYPLSFSSSSNKTYFWYKQYFAFFVPVHILIPGGKEWQENLLRTIFSWERNLNEQTLLKPGG